MREKCLRTYWIRENTLCKRPKFHLIFWCGNFVEMLSFGTVSGDSLEALRKLRVSANFPYHEIR